MRGMLDNLRSDLGISPPDDPYEPTSSEDVGMGVKRPEVRSRSKTTGYTGNINQFKNVRLGQQQQRADEKPLEYDKSNRKDEMVLTATIEPAETGTVCYTCKQITLSFVFTFNCIHNLSFTMCYGYALEVVL